jgi:hypothetical protein
MLSTTALAGDKVHRRILLGGRRFAEIHRETQTGPILPESIK